MNNTAIILLTPFIMLPTDSTSPFDYSQRTKGAWHTQQVICWRRRILLRCSWCITVSLLGFNVHSYLQPPTWKQSTCLLKTEFPEVPDSSSSLKFFLICILGFNTGGCFCKAPITAGIQSGGGPSGSNGKRFSPGKSCVSASSGLLGTRGSPCPKQSADSAACALLPKINAAQLTYLENPQDLPDSCS